MAERAANDNSRSCSGVAFETHFTYKAVFVFRDIPKCRSQFTQENFYSKKHLLKAFKVTGNSELVKGLKIQPLFICAYVHFTLNSKAPKQANLSIFFWKGQKLFDYKQIAEVLWTASVNIFSIMVKMKR